MQGASTSPAAAPASTQSPAGALAAAPTGPGPHAPHAPLPPATTLAFGERRAFWVKTLLLAVATVSLVPILLYKNEMAGALYLLFLAIVHVAGIVIIAVGTKRHQIAPDARGLVIRLVGLSILVTLLAMVAKGLRTSTSEWIFWGSLFAIWALHTLGLLMLHLKGRREQALCPFV